MSEKDNDVAVVLKKWNAILRLEYGIEPEQLNDGEWAKLVAEYKYIEERRREIFRADLKTVLYELAAKIYGKK